MTDTPERIYLTPEDAALLGQKYGHPDLQQVHVGDDFVAYDKANARIAELEAERDELKGAYIEADRQCDDAEARAEAAEAKLAVAETVQHAASIVLADRWGGYGNRKAMSAMWNFVYKEHNRHMLPQSHYDGVLQAGLRALAQLKGTGQ